MAQKTLTEKPGLYQEKFLAIKKQMKKGAAGKKYTDQEIDVMIKHSLVEEAKDKIDFSLRGQIRRGSHIKYFKNENMTSEEAEEAYTKLWGDKMRKRLEQDGFPFSLTKEEIATHEAIVAKNKKQAADELTKMASEAMRKILSTV